jgi:hypothetical protein
MSKQRKEATVVNVPEAACSSSSCNHSTASTNIEPAVTQDQLSEKQTDQASYRSIYSVKKKLSNMLDNPIFAGFLLILAGISIAFQAGNKYICIYIR